MGAVRMNPPTALALNRVTITNQPTMNTSWLTLTRLAKTRGAELKEQKPALNIRLLLLLSLFQFSCSSKWNVPADYIGRWETQKERVTVRVKPEKGPFRFISDSVYVTIDVHGDKTVSGTIGAAGFERVPLRKNVSLPWETGVEYMIECGSVGKLFPDDPLDSKEVEIWFAPIDAKGNSDSELRYTQGGSVFPMARLLFVKAQE